MHSKILSTGSFLPNKIISNHDLEKVLDTSDEWIFQRTGIKERRIAAENEDVALLGYKASVDALQNAGLQPSDIDMIIVGTTSHSSYIPSAACAIQEYLGVQNIPAFDISAACTGFIYAVSTADQFIKSGQAKRILVVGTDTLSKLCDPTDRTTKILFGDGAGAVILESSQNCGILSTHIHANGEHKGLLGAYSPIYRNPSVNNFIYMNGTEVFKHAVNCLSGVVQEVLDSNKIEKSSIDWLVPHQANIRIIKTTAKKLGLPMSKVIQTVKYHGNTSAASVPLALDFGIKNGSIKRGQNLLLEAFGAGFTWGAALIKY